MDLDTEELKRALVQDWEYSPDQVERVIQKILSVDPAILSSFQDWLANGEFPEKPVFSGLSPRILADAYPMKPPAVFLLLDWIRREPKVALQALVDEYKKPLPKGFKPAK
jgi:hypothetical protein